ncbi:MAG: hypothetical protein AAGA96_18545 [Verrucomicrobiota bacterium]
MGKVPIFIFMLTLFLGVVGLFPLGILRLVAGTGLIDRLREVEWEAKGVALMVFGIGSLLAILAYGLCKLRHPGHVVGVFFLLLTVVNLGGCAAAWNDLSGIH